MKLTWSFVFVAVLAAGTVLVAQSPASRPLSPDGIASVHVLGKWEKTEREQFTLGGERYVGGSWIDITYGRPMLRGREAFTGAGAEYGKAAYAGAPVWRAGANLSTRLKSSIPLVIGTTTVPEGEYSLFIELNSPTQWTFIVSSWVQAPRFSAPITDGLYGAFNYTPEKDVARAPMRVAPLPYQVEQLTWEFINMTATGGRMAIMWDKTMGSVPFSFGR
ncbi:MAG TPA: DUF2911 domain-containing protein [Vicinamibacterales bacterium]|nr:DUF2911 domain-containing protein [Vicinamibacterales bacterium]